MGLGSDISGIYTIAAWPMAAISDVQGDNSSNALVGLGVGGVVAYVWLGDPLPYIQDGNVVMLGVMYGVIGVGYWAGSMLADKITNSQ
jgi:hypothetical protein